MAFASAPSPAQIQPLAHSLPDAARQLGGVSISFLRLEIARGRLRAVHCGRRVLVMHDELLRYLAAGTRLGRSAQCRDISGGPGVSPTHFRAKSRPTASSITIWSHLVISACGRSDGRQCAPSKQSTKETNQHETGG